MKTCSWCGKKIVKGAKTKSTKDAGNARHIFHKNCWGKFTEWLTNRAEEE